jgi:hypothetical protein
MLAVWVPENNDPDYNYLRELRATHVFRALRDKRTTRAALVTDRAAGFETGVYLASNWYPGQTARTVADIASTLLNAVDGGTPFDPVVCLDVETDDLHYTRSLFHRWKAHRPKRRTDWTFEGHKGGIFTDADVADLLLLVQGYFVPQCYNGALTEVWDTLAMARDLTATGIPDERIVPFMDIRHIGEWASGYAFIQGLA